MERHPSRSIDSDRTVQVVPSPQPDAVGNNDGIVTMSSNRMLGITSQLEKLEQETRSTGKHSTFEYSRNIEVGANPVAGDVSIVAMNDIASQSQQNPQLYHDFIAKHKTFEKISTSVAVLHDGKLTLDMKIQKHIDLNLPTNKKNSHAIIQELQNIDSLLLRKMKEQFDPAASSNLHDNEETLGDIEESVTGCAAGVRLNGLHSNDNRRLNNLELDTGVGDNYTHGKRPVGSNHSIQVDDLEYDGMDEDSYDVRELAVAVHIDGDSQSNFPSAIQYDPNAKPFLHITRRFFLLVSLIGIAVVTGAVGACIGMILINKLENSTSNVSSSGSSAIALRTIVERIIPMEELHLDDLSSPYRKALNWMTSVDPNTLPQNDAKLAQRYLVAYLYFATSIQRPWETACAPNFNDTATVDDKQCAFTIMTDTLYDDMHYDQKQVTASQWLSGSDECQWAGIHCDRSLYVRSVDLSGFGLSGTFPGGIMQFPFLEEIRMGFGSLTGPLPDTLASMKHLVEIDLRNNSFTGTIPDTLYHIRSLQHLDVRHNHLTGTISKSISYWHDLKRLKMGDNELDGSIPTEIGTMNNVHELTLYKNNLNGTIPTTIQGLSALWELSIFHNHLTGTIPQEIGALTNLIDVRLHANELRGTIPRELWYLTNLWRLQLNSNHLNGTINRKIGQFHDLKYLYLNNNHFSGTIPSTIGLSALNRLREVSLEGNDFIGTMPLSICQKVENDQIIILIADCAGGDRGNGDTPTNNTIVPKIDCPTGCCTSCS